MAAKSIWGDTMQETLGPWTGKWLVNIKGDYNHHGSDGSGEISVVRADFIHGFRSYGWEGRAKFILKNWDKQVSQEEWGVLLAIAQIFADQLNNLDRFTNVDPSPSPNQS